MAAIQPVIKSCDEFVKQIMQMGKTKADKTGLLNPSVDDIIFLGAKELFVLQDNIHEVKSNNTTTAYQNFVFNCGTDATGNPIYRQLLLTFKDQRLSGQVMPTDKTLDMFNKENADYIAKFNIKVEVLKEGDASISIRKYQDESDKTKASDVYQALYIIDTWIERITEERMEYGAKLLAWCRENMTCTVATITDYIKKTYPGLPLRYGLIGELRSKQILTAFKGVEIPPNILEVFDKVFVKYYGDKIAKHTQTMLKTGPKMENPIARLKIKSSKKEDKDKKTITATIIPSLKNADLAPMTPGKPNFPVFTNPDGSPLTKDYIWKAVNNKCCLLGSFKVTQIIYSGNYISYEATIYDMILQTIKSAYSKISDNDLYGSDALSTIMSPVCEQQVAGEDANLQALNAMNEADAQ